MVIVIGGVIGGVIAGGIAIIAMAFTSGLRATRIATDDGLVGDQWAIYFRDQDGLIAASPAVVSAPVSLTSQHAAIATTPIPSDTLAPGLYRVSIYQRVTTAAGVSSSLTTAISWTDGGISCSFSGAAMTGNTTATTQSFSQLIRVDRATPVSYTTTYASNPATVMQYSLDVVLETVSV